MKILSPVFNHNKKIPAKYTCDGENINPPLEFVDIPNKAKSLVLICDDPDAPMGTWIHWVVLNIDPKTKEIPENSVPDGCVLGVTSFGSKKYGGPCPPSGEHRYIFKLYVLKEKLELNSDATMSELMKEIDGNILAEAELIGLYSRE